LLLQHGKFANDNVGKCIRCLGSRMRLHFNFSRLNRHFSWLACSGSNDVDFLIFIFVFVPLREAIGLIPLSDEA
jgi:hypothetical protein